MAATVRAPRKSVPSFFMIKVQESPPSPQEWQRHNPLSRLKLMDGVLSSCSTHFPMPVLRIGLYSAS
ncbi:hypothetical protein SEA_YOSIF_41 [Streptomyces phage Yosif]|uniref:Uncharacterized protein n=1 Tax=Streptomyces phage Yosif TaxID=2201421 RepID=A0A2Z4QDG0_9CAUD|nr:hypothetical protein KGG71_gp41 [Streptomyces phage Yosif]AWY07605.1 hypothetical protein SEA_YOSIF_41 [Streptomyces phage Yosif]